MSNIKLVYAVNPTATPNGFTVKQIALPDLPAGMELPETKEFSVNPFWQNIFIDIIKNSTGDTPVPTKPGDNAVDVVIQATKH